MGQPESSSQTEQPKAQTPVVITVPTGTMGASQ